MKTMFTVVVILGLLVPACAGGGAGSSAKGAVHVQGGTNIEGYGFALDASYDPRLDQLIPGYRIVNVALINNSFNILFLNPEKDRWSIRAGKGRRHDAIIDLRRADPEVWATLPERVQKLMAYPLAVPIGARLVLDLIVHGEAPLEQLTEVSGTIDSLRQTFVVSVRE